MPHAWLCCRPFVQRYAILLANGRGAYQPLDADCMEQRELAETVRKLLQAAKLDGWQVHIFVSGRHPQPWRVVSICTPGDS